MTMDEFPKFLRNRPTDGLVISSFSGKQNFIAYDIPKA